MNAPYTIFEKTKMVPVVTYTNRKLDEPPKEIWDYELWVERGEDFYALDSIDRENPGCTVRIIEREVWLRCPVVGVK